ncbi:MAG: PaaI family thioesterase, partial [Acidimicrobiales bacterium]
MRDMDRWLGDGGMPLITGLGAEFTSYGVEGDGAWSLAEWRPTELACNPHGVVQAGVHSVVLDAAMNFAVNSALEGHDRTRATLEMKTETMRAAHSGEGLSVRGRVARLARQVAYADGEVRDQT